MIARNVGYWIATALTAFLFLSGGIVQLLHVQSAVEGITALGYPEHLLTFLGACKVAGAVVIVLPGLARLKEWAYAGIALNLVAASFSHVEHHDPAGNVIAPLVILGIAAASWALRPQSRRLGAAPVQIEPAGRAARQTAEVTA